MCLYGKEDVCAGTDVPRTERRREDRRMTSCGAACPVANTGNTVSNELEEQLQRVLVPV
jgi:hypothetical protein